MISLDIQNDYLEYASILDDKYIIIDTIGQGRYAKVKLGVNIEDKQKYAIKLMQTDPTTSQVRLAAFINEVETQANLDHKNIIKIIECHLDGQYRKLDGRIIQVSYFVMELADQGELYELIEQTPMFSEKLARNIFLQLVRGIEHLHERGIVHRDIKSENILFSNGTLKLADFGFCAKTVDENGSKSQFEVAQYVGSPEYNPPELTNPGITLIIPVGKQKYYSPESTDIFAAGVILFTMVMKSAPFKSTKNGDPYYQLLKNDRANFWQVFKELNSPSVQFKELIDKMMDENPSKRLSLEQIKKHPWLQGPLQSTQDFQKELKSRHDTVINRMKAKITNKRDIKFQSRKTIKKVETVSIVKVQPKHLRESFQIIESINAKLLVKQPYKEFIQNQKNDIVKDNQMITQKQKTKTLRETDSKKSNSPATPPNDSDNN